MQRFSFTFRNSEYFSLSNLLFYKPEVEVSTLETYRVIFPKGREAGLSHTSAKQVKVSMENKLSENVVNKVFSASVTSGKCNILNIFFCTSIIRTDS